MTGQPPIDRGPALAEVARWRDPDLPPAERADPDSAAGPKVPGRGGGVALRGRRPRAQTGGMTVRRIRERERTRSSTRPPAWFNRFTVAVLRSPLHGLADADVCALTFRGRRSGRRITLPVLYAARGDALVVLVGDAADKQWWRNFRQPRTVEVVCHGRRSAATAHIMDRAEPGYDDAAATYRQRHHVAPGRGDRLLLVEPATA